MALALYFNEIIILHPPFTLGFHFLAFSLYWLCFIIKVYLKNILGRLRCVYFIRPSIFANITCLPLMNCSWVTFVAIPHGLLAPHVSLQKSYGNMVFPCDGLFAFYAGCFKKLFLLPLDWDIVHSCFAPFFHLTWIALFKHSVFFQVSVTSSLYSITWDQSVFPS